MIVSLTRIISLKDILAADNKIGAIEDSLGKHQLLRTLDLTNNRYVWIYIRGRNILFYDRFNIVMCKPKTCCGIINIIEFKQGSLGYELRSSPV